MENELGKKTKRRAQQKPQSKSQLILQRKKTTQLRFLENLQKSFGIIATACKATGIDRSCYYEWIEKDQDFKSKVAEVSEYTKDLIESKALERVMADSDKMIIYMLSTKCKDRGYIQDRNHNVTADVTHQEKMIDLDSLTDEEKVLMAKIYSKE